MVVLCSSQTRALAVLIAASLVLAACATRQGTPSHPHGYGHRDSPGRAWPVALPLPGYDYRFRPDPQGMGRDLAPWSPHAHGAAWPDDRVTFEAGRAASSASVETYSLREEYSEEVYVEHGYMIEATPHAPAPVTRPADPGPRPYLDPDPIFY